MRFDLKSSKRPLRHTLIVSAALHGIAFYFAADWVFDREPVVTETPIRIQTVVEPPPKKKPREEPVKKPKPVEKKTRPAVKPVEPVAASASHAPAAAKVRPVPALPSAPPPRAEVRTTQTAAATPTAAEARTAQHVPIASPARAEARAEQTAAFIPAEAAHMREPAPARIHAASPAPLQLASTTMPAPSSVQKRTVKSEHHKTHRPVAALSAHADESGSAFKTPAPFQPRRVSSVPLQTLTASANNRATAQMQRRTPAPFSPRTPSTESPAAQTIHKPAAQQQAGGEDQKPAMAAVQPVTQTQPVLHSAAPVAAQQETATASVSRSASPRPVSPANPSARTPAAAVASSATPAGVSAAQKNVQPKAHSGSNPAPAQASAMHHSGETLRSATALHPRRPFTDSPIFSAATQQTPALSSNAGDVPKGSPQAERLSPNEVTAALPAGQRPASLAGSRQQQAQTGFPDRKPLKTTALPSTAAKAAASPPVAAESGSANTDSIRKGFLQVVWSKIFEEKYYPQSARDRGYEGMPVVAFTLGRDGALKDYSIVKSSSHKMLDRAALEAVKAASPFPPIPATLKQNSIRLNLPISFILEEP